MKALSLTQPWASLIAFSVKRIETRSWGTNYRGPLAIHAAKGMPRPAFDMCFEEPFLTTLRAAHLLGPSDLPRGAVVATCRLVDCLPILAKPNGHACVAPDDEGLIRAWTGPQLFASTKAKLQVGGMTTEHEAAFGDYTPGRFGWVLDDIQPLHEPVPARGSLGLWNWEAV